MRGIRGPTEDLLASGGVLCLLHGVSKLIGLILQGIVPIWGGGGGGVALAPLS
jgi:hypothetical protein